MEELRSDTERAEYLQNMLIAIATGGSAEVQDYKDIRAHFMNNPVTKELLPKMVVTNRDLTQFWGYIKPKFSTYKERREFIYVEFTLLLDYLEGKNKKPSDNSISEGLKTFDEAGVHAIWAKALERRLIDPEGAITAARTLLESVCKHILDEQLATYDKQKIELPELYKLTSQELNIAPSQHTVEIFKQILGGVHSVVVGLGALRNKLGDAHGQGKSPVKPAPRHAALAVNLAGATAVFLIETWQFKLESESKL